MLLEMLVLMRPLLWTFGMFIGFGSYAILGVVC